MKSIRFIVLTLIFTLLLTACERPAPEGEIPPPVDNGTEIVPRTDEAYPAQPTDAAPIEATVAAPTTTTEDATGGNTDTQTTDEETNSTDTDTTTEEAADETPALEDGVYVVRSGDTLGQIAFAFGISVEDIVAANNLTNPDSLDVGQELVIPDEGLYNRR